MNDRNYVVSGGGLSGYVHDTKNQIEHCLTCPLVDCKNCIGKEKPFPHQKRRGY